MLRREILVPTIGVVAVAAAAGGGWWWWDRSERQEAEQQKAEAEEEREQNREKAREWVGKLQDESVDLMPRQLEGLALGMPMEEVKSLRSGARPSDKDEQGLTFLEEKLKSGSQVMYGFDAVSKRLIKVQVMSRLPRMSAVKPHLAAMNERYGSPTGMWNCPDTGGVPTLRFTWRKNVTSVADIFLFHPGGVSQTLYLAPTETIGGSLKQAGCKPTTPEKLKKAPPVATKEQLDLGKQAGGGLQKQGGMR